VNIAIIGAGCIGAGFLYPMLHKEHAVDVYDLTARQFTYKQRIIKRGGGSKIENLYMDQLPIAAFPRADYDLVFIAVGCSAFLSVLDTLRRTPAGATVICCDNMKNPAGWLRKQIPSVLPVNGYPWVSVIREDGGFLAEDGYICLPLSIGSYQLEIPEIAWIDDDNGEWLKRLVIHCGTHAVVAYNGWADGCETIPEALAKRDYAPMWSALRDMMPNDVALVDRERERFSDERFPDPVMRVARNPYRKLLPEERLAMLREYVSVHSKAAWLVERGIKNAVKFGELYDPVVMQWLRHMDETAFLWNYHGWLYGEE